MLTRGMEVAATFNPVTYVMEAPRSLELVDLNRTDILQGYAMVAVCGALILAFSVRVIQHVRLRRETRVCPRVRPARN